MFDVNEILQDARGNILNAICKLSVIQSLDADTFKSIDEYRTLVNGIKQIVDAVNDDLYHVVLTIEG